jgi:hypothetical protein
VRAAREETESAGLELVPEDDRQLAGRRAAAAKLNERLCAIEVVHIRVLSSPESHLTDKPFPYGGRESLCTGAGAPVQSFGTPAQMSNTVSTRAPSALAKDISAKKLRKRINTDWCVFNTTKLPAGVVGVA